MLVGFGTLYMGGGAAGMGLLLGRWDVLMLSRVVGLHCCCLFKLLMFYNNNNYDDDGWRRCLKHPDY